MKRPIAELLTISLQPGTEAERLHYEHEAWQIIRRKQGYVTHRIYRQLDEPLRWFVYSEWESKKAADGARQHLQGTPLMRRGRATLTGTPERVIVELAGAVTSTKGLDLSDGAVAVRALGRLGQEVADWRAAEEQLTKTLAGSPGHIAHVLFRGLDDPFLVGSLSHWRDADAFEKARPGIDAVAPKLATFATPTTYLLYRSVRD